MVVKKKMSFDLGRIQQDLSVQFRNLDSKDPSSWPAIPRYLLCLVVVMGVATLLWFLHLNQYEEELQAERAKELVMRDDYRIKLTKAVNLEALKKQREQVQQFVIQLEKQLPSKAEMAALLSDINQSGLGRSLQFDLFRPGTMVLRDFYAELPIELQVTGSYHDMGAFAADVANLSRIVTLNNINIVPAAKGSDSLSMNAVARTFRYLDADEVLAQSKVKGAGK